MINTIPQLAAELNKLYPTRYSHFTTAQSPPFICYIDDGENNTIGDNKVINTSTTIRIELYSKTKDWSAEGKIKTMLSNNEIPYEKDPTLFIKEEGLFLTTFYVDINEN